VKPRDDAVRGERNGRPRVVIVGGGAGGLELATRLGRAVGGRAGRAEVTLVDRSATHVWKPRLHEVATGLLNAGEQELGYFAHAHRHGYRFVLGALVAIDTPAREIVLAPLRAPADGADRTGPEIAGARRLPYDHLVLALGSRTNDFGVPGVAQWCHVLDSREEADRLHRTLLTHALRAQLVPGGGRLSVAIVGGGPTGVELAAELHHAARELSAYGDGLGPENLDLTLIDALDRLLGGSSPAASARAMQVLRESGVDLVLGQAVTAVDGDGLTLADGRRVPAEVKVWVSGIKGFAFLSAVEGLTTTPAHRVVVDETLRSLSDRRIFALGDCAHCPDPATGKPLPATAQVAQQQAKTLARSLVRVLDGRPPLAFRYRDRGMLVSLGRGLAVGSVVSAFGRRTRHLDVSGAGAKFLYVSLYRMHQAGLHGWPRAILLMLSDWLRRASSPPVKFWS
jgi:NADH:ubiquinone reductase (H+-translocating)